MDTQTTVRVKGDWLPEDHPGYEAVVVDHWNGWACPLFTEAEARKVADDCNALAAEHPSECSAISVHNDPVEFVEHPGDMTEEEADMALPPLTDYVGANDDGLFAIGSYGWCWYEMEA